MFTSLAGPLAGPLQAQGNGCTPATAFYTRDTKVSPVQKVPLGHLLISLEFKR
jgi:hypothetical protein